ncbi:MAG: alanine dehydrogenase [Hadesarchaea archaeon]|nr:alanine dehydrogenase [Hadesarchaea archaeon]
MEIKKITKSEIEKLISIEDALEAVEEAFEAKGTGKTQMPPKSYIYFKKFDGDFRVMPAYLEELGAAGVKVVNVHPKNPESKGMPSVMATVILLSPETGSPIAFMDGTLITGLRTGAAGGVAAKYLARKDSRKIGMVGTGAQARTQLSALNEVLEINEVKAYSRDKKLRREFTNKMSEEFDFEVESVNECKEAVIGMDVIVTTTPTRSPIISNKWISEGMHINAIGADAQGKQELDSKILQRAKIVIDDWEQASHSGEINVPLSEGEITRDNMYGDIGEVVSGEKDGRTSNDEITVFDSTGLAVQDIATAWKVYQLAEEKGVGDKLNLF